MAVSKRLRFEILRRDNHTCRYCGGHDNLTIDHVVPTALGGSDQPANLVAACKDCNSGKSATPADAPLVEDVAQDALRWANAMRVVADQAQEKRETRRESHERFGEAWDQYSSYYTKLPDDWMDTIDRMVADGLTIEDLLDFAYTSLTKYGVTSREKFRYFCGIAWKTLTRRQEAARKLLADAEPPPEHCGDACGVHHGTTVCHKCGEYGCTWGCGYVAGVDDLSDKVGTTGAYGILLSHQMSKVSDGRMLAEMGLD